MSSQAQCVSTLYATHLNVLKKVYLAREVDGQNVVIDSAVVEKGSFRFEGVAPCSSRTLITLQAFDKWKCAVLFRAWHYRNRSF